MSVTVLNKGQLTDGATPTLQETLSATTNGEWGLKSGHRAVAYNEDTGDVIEVMWAKAGEAIANGAACASAAADGTMTQLDPNAKGVVGVAMTAMASGAYGWFAVRGRVRVKAGDVAANGADYISATAGQLDDALVAGDRLRGAVFVEADVTTSGAYNANTAMISLNYPEVTDIEG